MHTTSPPGPRNRRTRLRRYAWSVVVVPLVVVFGVGLSATSAAAPSDPSAPGDQGSSQVVTDPSPDGTSSDGTATDGTATDATATDDASRAGCTLGPKLVPTCGHLWGAAPAAFSGRDREVTLGEFERAQQRPIDIYHGYHENNQTFPTAAERQITLNPSQPRLLLVAWRPATDLTWAAVANGKVDDRIDRAAQNFKSYPQKFYLAVWHEGEHYVKQTAGSGMQASDYRNMVRHVISRLKSKGVTNAVFTQIHQGYPNFAAQPWWPQMYPGDDMIDWLAVDSYNSGSTSGYNSGDFHDMMNRTIHSWKGWYNWASTNHPSKPLMLAEWGVWFNRNEPTRMAWFYDKVRTQLADFPKLKALLYFNTINQPKGDTAITSNASSLSAYRQLTASIKRVDLSNRK